MSDSITLEWEPAPVIEPRHRLKSYVVERFIEEPPPPRWERLASLPITVTRYTVPGLSPGRRYKFRVFGETHEGLTGSPYEYEPPQYSPLIGGESSLTLNFAATNFDLKRLTLFPRFLTFSTLFIRLTSNLLFVVFVCSN